MKIKIDYVTNSSSTGYVFYGYSFDKNDKIFSKLSEEAFYDPDLLVKEMDLPKCVDAHSEVENELIVIGKSIMYTSDEGIDEKDVDLDKLLEDAKKVAKIVKDTFGLTKEPNLIGWVRGQGWN